MNKTSKKSLSALIVLASMTSLSATSKSNDGVIMTIDGEDIPSSEFIYLYNKNNQQQQNPLSIEEYLQLFEVYRLKVAEAKTQGVDTTQAFQKEMAQYRRDLLEPYVTDTLYFQSLVDEARRRDSVLVESSHIMIIRTNDETKDQRNLALLDSLHKELKNGADFIEIAKEYSQDKFSSQKGGYLGFSPAGTYPYGFETAVYETPEGEISEIVESHVGWHIVKSGARKLSEEFNRPYKSNSDIRTDVERKTSTPFDHRYHELRKRNLEILRQRHPEFNSSGLSDEDDYEQLLVIEQQRQYTNNADYRNLVDEYVNGSLLYAVSVENVWDKASSDIEGLRNFYEKNASRYSWDAPHAKGVLIQAANDSVAREIKQAVIGLPSDSIVPFVRKEFKKMATADRFNVPEGVNSMIDNVMFGAPETTPKSKNFTTYFVVEGRLVESPECLEDVKSVVINDYQEELEKNWVNDLKKRHTVAVNDKELKKLRKKLQN